MLFSSIQQVNSKITPPLLPRFIETRQNMIYQPVNGEKNPIYNFFEFLKLNFYPIQQVNRKITPPLLPRLIDMQQNITYQQLNREKKPYILFWVSENEFLLNSTSQQRKNLYMQYILSCWKQIAAQFNKSTANSHHPFSQVS